MRDKEAGWHQAGSQFTFHPSWLLTPFALDPRENPAACQRLPILTGMTSFPVRFVAKSQSRVARPTRGDAQARGVLEKYVEELSDEPVGLATLGSGPACRSSGSAIGAEPSCTFEAGDFGKQDRGEGEGQPQN